MREKGMQTPANYRRKYKALINQLFDRRFDQIDITYDPYKYKQGKKMSTKDEILKNSHAVVRFTATWCPPCKQMAPIFDEVAAAHPDVKVYVIDVDKDKDAAVDFGVRGIPTLIKIVDQAEQTRTVGGQPKQKIEELFKK
jgi:thioredoxin 1